MKQTIKKAMAFAVKDITGRVLRNEVLESMYDDFKEDIDKEEKQIKEEK